MRPLLPILSGRNQIAFTFREYLFDPLCLDLLMNPLNVFFLIALWTMSSSAFSGCIKGGKLTTPSNLFVVAGNEVHDTRTQLLWGRCPVGMTLRGNKCKGTAKLLTLADAEKYVKQLGDGWRLPTINELLGIVEHRCSNPSINTEIFPGVVELYEGHSKYWSSTPFKEMPMIFYNLDFMDGSVDANSRGIAMGVRLVRDKQK